MNRTLTTDLAKLQGLRVDIYRNLNRESGTFSIRAAEGPLRGRVLGHAKQVELRDCTFHVSARGRARVLERRRKEVHAVIRGVLQEASTQAVAGASSLASCLAAFGEPAGQVTYDPYRFATFVEVETLSPVSSSNRVVAYGNLVLSATNLAV